MVRAAGVDPAQFGREDGVEYYELSGGEWEVTAIGSGPVEYEWNVGLAAGPDGLPSISYYDQEAADMMWAGFDGSA